MEELSIKHDEYVVPSEVLLGLEKKKNATAKNATVTAEAKKRKCGGTAKVTSMKQKVGVVMEVPVKLSSNRTSTVASNSVDLPAAGEVLIEVVAATLEPSTINSLSSLLSEDSSDAEVPFEDLPRKVTAGIGASGRVSLPVEVEIHSGSKAESGCARGYNPADVGAQPAGHAGAGSFDLYMGE